MKVNNKQIINIMLCICLIASSVMYISQSTYASGVEEIWQAVMDTEVKIEQGWDYTSGAPILNSASFQNGKWVSEWAWETGEGRIGDITDEGFKLYDLKSKKHWWGPYHKLNDTAPNMEFGDSVRITMDFSTNEISKITNKMQLWLRCLESDGNGYSLFSVRNGDGNTTGTYKPYTASIEEYWINANELVGSLSDNTSYKITIIARQSLSGEAYDLSYTLKDLTNGTTVAKVTQNEYKFFDPSKIRGLGFKVQNVNVDNESSDVIGSGEQFLTVKSLKMEKSSNSSLPVATFTPENGARPVPIDTNVVVKFDKEVEPFTADNVSITNGASVVSVEMDENNMGAVINLANLQKSSEYTVTLSRIVQKYGTTENEYSTSFITGEDIYFGDLYRSPNKIEDNFDNFATKAEIDYGNFADDKEWKAGKLWAYEIGYEADYNQGNTYDFTADSANTLIEGKNGMLVAYNNYFKDSSTDTRNLRQAVCKKIPSIDVNQHQDLIISMDIWHSGRQWINNPYFGISLANSKNTWNNRVIYAMANGGSVWQAFSWGPTLETIDYNLWTGAIDGELVNVSNDWEVNGWRTEGWCRLIASFQYNESSQKYDLTMTLKGLDKQGEDSYTIEGIDPAALAEYDTIRLIQGKNEGLLGGNEKIEIAKIDNFSVQVGDGTDSLITGTNSLKLDYKNFGDTPTDLRAFVTVFHKDDNILESCSTEVVTLNPGDGTIYLPDVEIDDLSTNELKVFLFDDNCAPMSSVKQFNQ